PAYPHSSPPLPSLSFQLCIVDRDYPDHLTLERVLREADVDLCRILKEADREINRADTRVEKERYRKSVMDELYLRKDGASDDVYVRLNIIQQKYIFLFNDEDADWHELERKLNEWWEEMKNASTLNEKIVIQKYIPEELDMRSGRVETIEKGDRRLDL